MAARDTADAVLALAFAHCLTIALNLPLPQIVDLPTRLRSSRVVEFVAKDDRMAKTLLMMRETTFPDYDLEHFLD